MPCPPPRCAAIAAACLLGSSAFAAEPFDHGLATSQQEAFDTAMEASRRGDFAEAYCLWKPLAELGHTESEYLIGWMYANGHGLRVDFARAAAWWRKAAQAGHPEAQFTLGRAYWDGKGIEEDRDQAVQWYLAAARQGIDDAQIILRTLAARGEPAALRQVTRLLQEGGWQMLGDPVVVQKDKVNIRSGPGTHHDIVTQLEKGTVLLGLAEKGGWVRIGIPGSGELAWIYAKLVGPPE
jgi:TPR repeat protein